LTGVQKKSVLMYILAHLGPALSLDVEILACPVMVGALVESYGVLRE
jgi:hypothetical protein